VAVYPFRPQVAVLVVVAVGAPEPTADRTVFGTTAELRSSIRK
jgi:hypothetical protein